MPPTSHRYARLTLQIAAALFLLTTGIVCPTVKAQTSAFLEQNGQVVMEAEAYDAMITRSGKSWVARTNRTGFIGSAAMVAEPDTGSTINTGYASTSPELQFRIQFTTPGTYYFWVRALPDDDSNNSLSVGINGQEVSTADRLSTSTFGSWIWFRSTMDGPVATIVVSSPGIHTVNVWMREDGFRLDRILLSNSSAFTPTGSGPSQSPRMGVDPRSLTGEWSAVQPWPYIAVHTHLLPTGNVLYYSSYYNADDPQLWDPVTGTVIDGTKAGYNIFCTGHAFLPDGRLFVTGGHVLDFVGLPNAYIYNPFSDTWSRQPDMNGGRWYPTTTMLANGDILVLSGQKDVVSGMNPMPQVWQAATGSWRNLTNALLVMPFYPYIFAAPNGKVFYAGPERASRYLSTSGAGAWTSVGNSKFGTRNWGTAVMYEPGKVLLVGGAQSAFYGTASAGQLPTSTAEVIDLNASTPSWRYVSSMNQRRKHLNATILPDGRVLVTGGSSGAEGTNEMSADPTYESEVWDPVTEAWTTWASLSVYRGYHATALLLPDGRILSASGDYGGPSYEVFSPPYLFKGARPIITSAPTSVNQAQTFFVQTPDAASITKATIISLSSVTHGFNMSQRFNKLSFSQVTGGLNINVPSDPNLCPPGYYMLFLLNGNGVPSMGKIIRITAPTTPNPPTNLTTTAGNSTLTNLIWTDNSSNEEGFKIERCQGSSCSNYSQIAQVSSGVTTYANTGLSANTTYRYRVRAYSGSLNSTFSNVASVTTPAPPPIGNGTGLKGDYFNNMDFTNLKLTRTDGTINFDWGTGSPNGSLAADTFSVRWTGQVQPRFTEAYTFYTTSDDGVRLWVNGTQIINNWTDHGPVENSGTISMIGNQKYDIVMEYYENGAGAVATLSWSSTSQGKQIIPQSQLYPVVVNPAAPANLTTTQVSTSHINLAWTDNSDNEAGFKIERCQGAGCSNFVQIAQVGTGETTYSNTSLTSGTIYAYRVRAFNNAGNSAYSNTASATTLTPPTGPTVPVAPSNLLSAVASSNQINLTWTDNSNDETGFRIERSTDNVSFGGIATVGANLASYSDNGLAVPTTYYYRIRAYNTAGNSAYSNTTNASLTVSYVLSATPSTITTNSPITVNWSAPAGHSAADWIGLYSVGAADANFISWQYNGAAASGSLTFTGPAQSGQFEFRYFLNNGFTRIATSNQVTVSTPNSPASTYDLSATPGTTTASSLITVSWSAPADHFNTDWIGLYIVGASNSSFVSWQYTGGALTGTMTFISPPQSGQYEFRYFVNNGFTSVATSNPVTVTGP